MYDKQLIAKKLRRWEKYMDNYSLPTWEEIPDFGLYMDQIITLLKRYLDYLPPDVQDGEVITAATINNYVRKKIMPEPVKKRYYRIHVAYLIMICSLKQTLSMNMISTMIPADLPEDRLRETYTKYSQTLQRSGAAFVQDIRIMAGKILDHEPGDARMVEDTDELVVAATAYSGYAKLLAEKLIALKGKKVEDLDPEELI
ncbi:MAG: DUF1836 domain-containing protein [Lachnospiraceae bacterium]|nr:DUF1836 domain-containing protein [Lachnospiraceae bacterium]